MSGRQVFAMILAAGHGRRMGRLKQLMPYGDGTMLDAVVDGVLDSPVDGLIIVANREVARALKGRLPERCFVTRNDAAKSPMIVSAILGLDCLRHRFKTSPDDGVMILLADQPQVTGGLISTCAESYRLPRKPPGILIATYKGRRGHPAVFSLRILEEIETWSDRRRLHELARLHPAAVRELPITTCAMPIDVNTPEDYARLTEGS